MGAWILFSVQILSYTLILTKMLQKLMGANIHQYEKVLVLSTHCTHNSMAPDTTQAISKVK